MNYYDILFARKMAGGQGEITTEGLSVTENGTYTAPEGKAYTPVVVNVSGYKIKDIPNTPTAIATFNASALPMPSLKVGIEPKQEGSGDPSPSNIRPISGWDEVNVTVADDVDNPTTTKTITIQLGDTYYGGKLDVVNGVLTVDKGYVDLGTLTWTHNSLNRSINSSINTLIKVPSRQSSLGNYLAEKYKQIAVSGTLVNGEYAVSQAGDIIFYYDNVKEPTGLFVYELATPQTYQLNPTMVKSLLGTNNIWANTGDVLEGSYFKEL